MPVSLHTHSWYSLLEGVSSLEALLRRAAEGGHTALALTDTNNLYGVVPFVELATKHGIRPIVGACLRLGRERAVALVADRAGYRNLCRVISRVRLTEAGEAATFADRVAGAESSTPRQSTAASSLEVRSPGLRGLSPGHTAAASGCSQRPLTDLLAEHAEGLHLLVDDADLAGRLHDAFHGRLWLEIIRPRPPRHEERLLECGQRLGLKAVASTAVHLADAGDYPTFRVVTAMRQRTLLDRLPAVLSITPEHRLLSADEMRQRFRDLPEAIGYGDRLAELLRVDVLPRELILPKPRLSRDLDLVAYLRGLCERGLRERDLGGDLAARQRLREELSIIEASSLPGYFLTVRDIARAARKRGHTMALRGSAGNSLVCYLLGITDVDPLRFGLEMERFLHPGRVDLPDIDLDFDWKVRDSIIDYVIERYGSAHVARISAHLFIQPRSAFREAGKLHGLSSDQVSELLTHLEERVDDVLLPPVPIEESEEAGAPLPVCDLQAATRRLPRAFPLESGRWPRIIADARRLLGRPMNVALHPGGIVLTPQPIDGYVPVQWAAKGLTMTQFDKDAVEYVGLVKIDLLGNRALSTVDEARQLVAAAVPGSTHSDGDPATLALLQRGDTLGVTQLESPAMRHLLVQMRPSGLDDVVQSLALLRPGAASIGMKERFIRRRAGLEPDHVAHPALEALLGPTHGLMLYEDDSLRLLQALTGLPGADADRFRKRISKHRTAEEAEMLRQEFVALCVRRGVPAAALTELWQQLAKFNRYSFCKSHAVSYGLIAWQAAYLKAHHPLAFWTAALNNNMGAYSRRVYVEAIKRAGLALRLPCVNRSALAFQPEDGAIRTGLEAVAGLPGELRLAIISQRDQAGPYRDLADLRRRLSPGPEALAVLIRSGALDFTGRSRPALVLEARLQDAWRSAVCAGGGKGAGQGQGELFRVGATDGWSPPDDPPERRWRDEWETLGFVLGPPLFSLFRREVPEVKRAPLIGSHEVPRHAGRRVRVQGLVATARNVVTEQGKPIQFVTLEDEHGLAEVTLFGGTCAQVPYLTMGPYLATGVVEERYGAYTVTAQRFERMDEP
jgi:DNA-directed DNA polymerase III PolC